MYSLVLDIYVKVINNGITTYIDINHGDYITMKNNII